MRGADCDHLGWHKRDLSPSTGLLKSGRDKRQNLRKKLMSARETTPKVADTVTPGVA
jgi:hypothetical protein